MAATGVQDAKARRPGEEDGPKAALATSDAAHSPPAPSVRRNNPQPFQIIQMGAAAPKGIEGGMVHEIARMSS